ncbi:MAG TPA: gel scht [Duganella sp.]
MKTTLSSIAAALVIAVSSMSAVHAQDPSVQINANAKAAYTTASYYVTPVEFADFAHAYRLTNGQVLKFTQSGNHYFTQLDDGKRVRVFALSRDEFVTADGAKMIFGEGGDTVGVDNFEKLPMAAKLPPNTTMMMARR